MKLDLKDLLKVGYLLNNKFNRVTDTCIPEEFLRVVYLLLKRRAGWKFTTF